MNMQEYKNEVLRLLRLYIGDEGYIKELDEDIEKHYTACMKVKSKTGCEPDPKAYVLGIQFLYPELP